MFVVGRSLVLLLFPFRFALSPDIRAVGPLVRLDVDKAAFFVPDGIELRAR